MTKYNPNIHHRRSIRLKGYDYSQQGLYFITICTQNRLDLFGKINNGKIILNDAGKMIKNIWNKIPNDLPNIRLHDFIVMPNHFHAIIQIVGADSISAQIDNSISAQTDNSISAQIDNSISAQTDNSISAQIDNSISAQIDNSISAQTDNSISAQIDNSISAQIDNSISAQIDNSISAQIDNSISAQIDNSISAQTDNSISAQTDNSISAQTDNSISAQTDNSISAQIDNSISAQTDNSISAQIDNSISAQTDNSISAPTGTKNRADKRADMESAPTVSLSTVVQSFKRHTTIEYIKMVKQNILRPFKKRVWQRNYWEHIIRNENEYQRISRYIIDNPQKWQQDKFNDGTGNVVTEPDPDYGKEIWMV